MKWPGMKWDRHEMGPTWNGSDMKWDTRAWIGSDMKWDRHEMGPTWNGTDMKWDNRAWNGSGMKWVGHEMAQSDMKWDGHEMGQHEMVRHEMAGMKWGWSILVMKHLLMINCLLRDLHIFHRPLQVPEKTTTRWCIWDRLIYYRLLEEPSKIFIVM